MRRVLPPVPSTPRPSLLTTALACALTVALWSVPAVGAVAAPGDEPADVPRANGALSAPTPFARALLRSDDPVETSSEVTRLPLDDDGDALVTRRQERRIAPGLELTRFARMSEDGWLSGEVLVADLGGQADGRASGPAGGGHERGTVQVGYIGPDRIAGTATVSEMAAARGAVGELTVSTRG